MRNGLSIEKFKKANTSALLIFDFGGSSNCGQNKTDQATSNPPLNFFRLPPRPKGGHNSIGLSTGNGDRERSLALDSNP